MARREFDPRDQGWKKTEYRQGDVQDKKSVRDAVKGADVVVHLAFAILSASDATRAINIDGSRNVFDAAVEAGAERIAYASSVAAYGFHADNPDWLTEDVEPRGTPEHFYSQQKAEVEGVLAQALLKTTKTHAWVFRPCIVAGPQAPLLVNQIPYVRLSGRLPAAVRALFDQVPVLRPVIPDPGVPFQLVHHDDVASALKAGVLGRGEPGAYNLAGAGEITMRDLADELGYYTVPVPDLAVEATAEVVARLPFLPDEATWIEAVRRPVLMDTAKARRLLRWRPRHDARETLHETVAAARGDLEPA
jgi:UDP-glucose 4-epimerase